MEAAAALIGALPAAPDPLTLQAVSCGVAEALQALPSDALLPPEAPVERLRGSSHRTLVSQLALRLPDERADALLDAWPALACQKALGSAWDGSEAAHEAAVLVARGSKDAGALLDALERLPPGARAGFAGPARELLARASVSELWPLARRVAALKFPTLDAWATADNAFFAHCRAAGAHGPEQASEFARANGAEHEQARRGHFWRSMGCPPQSAAALAPERVPLRPRGADAPAALLCLHASGQPMPQAAAPGADAPPEDIVRAAEELGVVAAARTPQLAAAAARGIAQRGGVSDEAAELLRRRLPGLEAALASVVGARALRDPDAPPVRVPAAQFPRVAAMQRDLARPAARAGCVALRALSPEWPAALFGLGPLRVPQALRAVCDAWPQAHRGTFQFAHSASWGVVRARWPDAAALNLRVSGVPMVVLGLVPASRAELLRAARCHARSLDGALAALLSPALPVLRLGADGRYAPNPALRAYVGAEHELVVDWPTTTATATATTPATPPPEEKAAAVELLRLDQRLDAAVMRALKGGLRLTAPEVWERVGGEAAAAVSCLQRLEARGLVARDKASGRFFARPGGPPPPTACCGDKDTGRRDSRSPAGWSLPTHANLSPAAYASRASARGPPARGLLASPMLQRLMRGPAPSSLQLRSAPVMMRPVGLVVRELLAEAPVQHVAEALGVDEPTAYAALARRGWDADLAALAGPVEQLDYTASCGHRIPVGGLDWSELYTRALGSPPPPLNQRCRLCLHGRSGAEGLAELAVESEERRELAELIAARAASTWTRTFVCPFCCFRGARIDVAGGGAIERACATCPRCRRNMCTDCWAEVHYPVACAAARKFRSEHLGCMTNPDDSDTSGDRRLQLEVMCGCGEGRAQLVRVGAKCSETACPACGSRFCAVCAGERCGQRDLWAHAVGDPLLVQHVWQFVYALRARELLNPEVQETHVPAAAVRALAASVCAWAPVAGGSELMREAQARLGRFLWSDAQSLVEEEQAAAEAHAALVAFMVDMAAFAPPARSQCPVCDFVGEPEEVWSHQMSVSSGS